MAVLVAVGGALVGSAFGYANAGWIVGSVLGQLLFPGSGTSTTVEGPRLGDLTVTASTYGATVPIVFGTARLAGNMIWSKGIEEEKTTTTTKSGGKGGKKKSTQTTVTYQYYSTFGVSVCAGPVSALRRMWADGKLIFDSGATGDAVQKNGVSFRFYYGDEGQQPDSLIVADKGEANTPAYRGTAYIVFDRLPLKDFGNRVPSLTFEVVASDAARQDIYVPLDPYTVAEGGISDDFNHTTWRPDFSRGLAFNTDPVANVVRRVNTRTMAEEHQAFLTTDSNGLAIRFPYLAAILPVSGRLVIEESGGNRSAIVLVDPNSLSVIATFGYNANAFGNSSAGFELATTGKTCAAQSGDGSEYVITGSATNSVGVLSGNLTYLWDSDTYAPILDSRVLCCAPGVPNETTAYAYYITGANYVGSPVANNVNLYRLSISGSSVTNTLVASITPGALIPGETTLSYVHGLILDQTDGNLITTASPGADLSIGNVIKLSASDGHVIWSTRIPDGTAVYGGFKMGIINARQGWNHTRIQNGKFVQMENLKYYYVRTTDGALIEYGTGTWAEGFTNNGAGFWDDVSGAFYGRAVENSLGKWVFFRVASAGVGLDDIVGDMCSRSGMSGSDYDVTDLASQEVPGYLLSRITSARSVIEQLAQIYAFDGVESDGVLKFLLRNGKASVATITQDLLVPKEDNGIKEFFVQTRVQDAELPSVVSIRYMDRNNDYQQQAHTARRVRSPVLSMNSKVVLAIEAPIVLDTEIAKRRTESILYSAWIERESLSFEVPWQFLYLDPADIVTVQLDDGTSFRARVSTMDVGGSLSIELTAITEDAAQYTSTLSAYGGSGIFLQEFLPDAVTKLILLDCPLLADTHYMSQAVTMNYFFMGGFGQQGWVSGTLFASAEGTEYIDGGSVGHEMTWGTAATALGDTAYPFQTDNTNTLRVFLYTNTDEGLTSVSEAEMLAGANYCALVSSNGDVELLNFQTAVVQDDGSYLLSGLLRGRRGTEWTTGGHAVGDTFLMLDYSTGERYVQAIANIGATRYYKGVTAGTLFETATVVQDSTPGNDLKPYAPVHLDITSGTWGGDIVLEWVRRTRYGAPDFNDGVSTTPLGEDSEEYILEVLYGDSLVKRTVTSITSETYTYTAANQATDFPGGWINVTAQLMTNADFENGLNGWTVSNDDACGLLSSGGHITAANTGTYFLSMEESTSAVDVAAYQDVDVSGWEHQIDQGLLQVRFTAYVASQTTDTDTGKVRVQWLDNAGTSLGTTDSSAVDPDNTGAWTAVQVSSTAPNNARTARLWLIGTSVTTSIVNVDWDTCSIEVDEGTKKSLSFRVYQVSAQVGRGFPSAVKTVTVV